MKGPPIILTTDFGHADEYVGVLKGVILSINPAATLVDLSHAIPPQDIGRAAELVFRNYRYFPHGSLHLCIIDPGVGTKRRIIVVSADGHLFLGPDNGVFTPLLHAYEQAKVYELTNRDWFLERISTTFHGRDIMAPAAAHLSIGAPIAEAGPLVAINSCVRIPPAEPLVCESEIAGKISSIDRFGNLITTIENHHLDALSRKSCLIVSINSIEVRFHQVSYAELPDRLPAAIINSSNLLEICVKNDDAAKVLGARIGDTVLVKCG